MVRLLLLSALALSACGGETVPEPSVQPIEDAALVADSLTITDGYAPVAPRGGTGGVFLTINTGPEDDSLLAALFDGAVLTELHETYETEDGLRGMREVEAGIPLPARSVFKLEPGGHHIMLMGLTDPIAAGDTLDIQLEFARAGLRRVLVLAKAPAELPAMGDSTGESADSE